MDGLIEGRIVHFVMNPSGEHRPAIITKVRNKEQGYVDLHVFLATDDPERRQSSDLYPQSMLFASATYSADTQVLNTWHWIERA